MVAKAKAKATQKPKEEPEVIVISSDDESEEKEEYVPKANKARDKDAKAFSSVLSARSKVGPPLFLFLLFYFLECCGLEFGVPFFTVVCVLTTQYVNLRLLVDSQGNRS